MAKRFLTSIDLSKNEIQNVVVHKLATAPANPVEGQIYYNTSDKRWYLRTDSAWKDVSGRIDDILSSTNAVIITDNGDGTLSIDIANATQSNAGLMSTADKTLIDSATDANTADSLVKRDASGNFAGNDVTVENLIINNAPTASYHAATKGYVDNLVASGVNIQGVIDCSTNPDYPAATAVGEAYHVSVAGRIGGGAGELVEVGDMIVAVAINAGGDQATVGNDWIVMQTNIDVATETSAGKIRIATTAEVTAGTNDETAVTPSKMAAYVGALITAGKYAADVGDGSATTITVTHALGTEDVSVQLRDTTTKELVETDVEITSGTVVTLKFAVAPASNAYRVVIQG